MNKLQIVYGFIIGIAGPVLGTFIFITAFTDFQFSTGIRYISQYGLLPQLIKLGAIVNLVSFFALLYYKKDDMAKGVLFASIAIAIITIFA